MKALALFGLLLSAVSIHASKTTACRPQLTCVVEGRAVACTIVMIGGQACAAVDGAIELEVSTVNVQRRANGRPLLVLSRVRKEARPLRGYVANAVAGAPIGESFRFVADATHEYHVAAILRTATGAVLAGDRTFALPQGSRHVVVKNHPRMRATVSDIPVRPERNQP